MTYIPKNRIKENLYTRGDEFILVGTREFYTGFYHSLYTGEFFTGKTQNDKPTEPIIKYEASGISPIPPNLENENKIALFLNDPDPIVDKSQWNQTDIVTYLKLKNKDIQDDDIRMMPQFHYSSPTEEDYQLGSFTRYFAVKVNELQYLEIDKKTYEKMNKQSLNITWELYQIFKIQWTLDGIESEVFDINRDQVLITERNINRLGLQEFLSNDYLKFYRSENLNNQYTSGDDYTLPNGLLYQGLYHVMPNGQAMTGRFHGEAEDIPLTPITS